MQTQGQRRRTPTARSLYSLARMLLYALWTVASLLMLVWLLGVAGAFAVGSTINFLLLVSVMLVMGSLFTRPRTI